MFGRMFKYSNKPTPLPKSRLDQFGDIMHYRWAQLALLSLLTLIFAIPFIAWMFITTIGNSSLFIELETATEERTMEIASILKSNAYFNALINVFLIAIMFVGFGGIAGVVKKYAWRDTVSTIGDFFKSVKKNFVFSFVIGLVYGLLIGAISVSDLYFTDNIFWNIIGFILIGIVTVFVMYLFLVSLFYKVDFKSLLFNSFVLSIARLPINLIILIVIYLPFVFLLFLPAILAVSLIILIYGMLWVGLMMLAIVLNGCSAFDKYVNKDNYPEIYKKGLNVGQNEQENAEHSLS